MSYKLLCVLFLLFLLQVAFQRFNGPGSGGITLHKKRTRKKADHGEKGDRKVVTRRAHGVRSITASLILGQGVDTMCKT